MKRNTWRFISGLLKIPEAFWQEQGQRLDWFKPYTKAKNTSFDKGHIDIKWYQDGQLNASYNCIDRHLETKADKVALIWEGDNPESVAYITYQKLHDEVCKLANGLRKLGVKKGDCVAIYMPMTPQAIYAMQACARIGAVHSVVFGGFSPSAIADRINNSNAKVVITSIKVDGQVMKYRLKKMLMRQYHKSLLPLLSM